MKVCVMGDHHATKSTYQLFENKIGVDGLPINDASLKRMLEFSFKRFDRIFWSCSYPLMGCEAINIIKELSKLPAEQRIIYYDKAKINKGFILSEWWKTLEDEDLHFLWVNYREMVQHYLTLYGDKLVLLPLATHYFDEKLGLEFKAMDGLKELTTQIVDLSPLAKLPTNYYQIETQFLTQAGLDAITSKFNQYLK